MSANDERDAFDDEDPVNGVADSDTASGPGLAVLLRVAAAFLTRLPIPQGPPGEVLPTDILARAMLLFPLVGAAIGALGSLVLLVAMWIAIPVPVAVIVALGAVIWLTGALHEDGLADVADGFGGGATTERKLAIMRDSRIGSYGVLALIVSLGLRATALAAIAGAGPWYAVAALVAVAAWSRSLFAPLMRWLPAARSDGVGAGAGQPASAVAWRGLVVGGGVALLVTLGGAGPAAILALLAGGIAAFIVGWLALDHVGGYTGDVLGAAQQAAETTTLIVLSAILTGGWV